MRLYSRISSYEANCSVIILLLFAALIPVLLLVLIAAIVPHSNERMFVSVVAACECAATNSKSVSLVAVHTN